MPEPPALDGLGLDGSTAFTVYLTLVNHVRGTALNLESEAEEEARSGMDSESWLQTQNGTWSQLLATGELPHLTRLDAEGYDFDLDALFEFGLHRCLDGLAVLFEGDAERR
ncbi:TetR/AcrR family transcriptional regulator C-terminal domain-containing protein [Streptomyces sp. NPDC059740]|uniref:TetR/AcrR family transcriptional regulator C-terminal domain-containing protein n=1 Tax=Streptomyces sp. NPDC059740 TaxID=3346926 RepID=UPI00364EBA09